MRMALARPAIPPPRRLRTLQRYARQFFQWQFGLPRSHRQPAQTFRPSLRISGFLHLVARHRRLDRSAIAAGAAGQLQSWRRSAPIRLSTSVTFRVQRRVPERSSAAAASPASFFRTGRSRPSSKWLRDVRSTSSPAIDRQLRFQHADRSAASTAVAGCNPRLRRTARHRDSPPVRRVLMPACFLTSARLTATWDATPAPGLTTCSPTSVSPSVSLRGARGAR